MTIYVVMNQYGSYLEYEYSQNSEDMVKGFTTKAAAEKWIEEHKNDKDSDGKYLYRLAEDYDDDDDPDVWNELYIEDLEVEE